MIRPALRSWCTVLLKNNSIFNYYTNITLNTRLFKISFVITSIQQIFRSIERVVYYGMFLYAHKLYTILSLNLLVLIFLCLVLLGCKYKYYFIQPFTGTHTACFTRTQTFSGFQKLYEKHPLLFPLNFDPLHIYIYVWMGVILFNLQIFNILYTTCAAVLCMCVCVSMQGFF